MKRGIALLVLLSILAAAPAMGQTGRASFGLKGGVNLARLAIDPNWSSEPQQLTAFGGGVVLSLPLGGVASLDSDFLYLQKGYSISGGDQIYGGEADVKYSYLTVSPMLRFMVPGRSVSPYLLAGGEFGYLLDAHYSGSQWSEGMVTPIDMDIKDLTNDYDWGVTFGGGMEMGSGPTRFFLEGRYSLGLADISPDEEQQAEEQGDGGMYTIEPIPQTRKHRGIYLFGGIRF